MTDLTIHQPTADLPQISDAASDSLTSWVLNLDKAHTLAKALCVTAFAPPHFKGKPEEAAAAILFGAPLGLDPLQSLQSLFVIGGKPSMYAQQMVALVQSRGHDVWTVESSDERVTVSGQRRGASRAVTETWDIERARKAGYLTNKKYATDPQAMLYARAVSVVCRKIAADVLAGIPYTVEEMQLVEDEKPASAPKPRGRDAILAATVQTDTGAGAAPAPPPAGDASASGPGVPETGEVVTEKQRSHLFASFAEVLGSDARTTEGRQARLEYMSRILGRPVETTTDLTVSEASRVLDALAEDRDQQLEDEAAQP